MNPPRSFDNKRFLAIFKIENGVEFSVSFVSCSTLIVMRKLVQEVAR